MNEVRYYKGKMPVEVLVKGKRQGNKGPLTWRVKVIGMEDWDMNAYFVTVPRLLWLKPRKTNANDETRKTP